MPKSLSIKNNQLQRAENVIKDLNSTNEKNRILEELDERLKSTDKKLRSDLSIWVYKSIVLLELDKGMLLSRSVPDSYRPCVTEHFNLLKSEFNCVTPSEKSLAEIASLNFVRSIFIQEKITAYLMIGTITNTGVGYLNMLSKDLDRAQRQYLLSINALRCLKSPPLEVNIKTQTAVVGNNQIVQSINKPI